jgi:hypothetical protein
MELPNITTRDSFPTIKNSHKAIMGAILVSERELVSFRYQRKVYWTLDFLVPPASVPWDVTCPLIFPNKKIQEMLSQGYLIKSREGCLDLTNGGASIARGCEYNWWYYWDNYFNRDNQKRVDWIQYLKTGVRIL